MIRLEDCETHIISSENIGCDERLIPRVMPCRTNPPPNPPVIEVPSTIDPSDNQIRTAAICGGADTNAIPATRSSGTSRLLPAFSMMIGSVNDSINPFIRSPLRKTISSRSIADGGCDIGSN
ncbi:MAG: hypothetical protein O2875_03205 [Planctomycetota bacterium]|nr:hypothetical protein [Planctomycetota bacterium]